MAAIRLYGNLEGLVNMETKMECDLVPVSYIELEISQKQADDLYAGNRPLIRKVRKPSLEVDAGYVGAVLSLSKKRDGSHVARVAVFKQKYFEFAGK